MKLAVCHPPYANMTGVIAAANPRTELAGCAVVLPAVVDMNPNTINIAIATSFRIISADCVLLPLRTPRMLMIVRAMRVREARTASPIVIPLSSIVYRAKVTATAAMPPLCTSRDSLEQIAEAMVSAVRSLP